MSKWISYDWSGARLPDTGLEPEALRDFSPQLKAARREALDVDLACFGGPAAAIPAEKQPLDAGFIEMPHRILQAYHDHRADSELGQILEIAKLWRDEVDRVVVLGIGGSYMGARALMDSCLHPYHNELTRGQRGSVPRIYFAGNNLDNDATQALLQLLQVDSTNWGVVVISKSGGTLETAAALRLFLRSLQEYGGEANTAQVARRVIPVTGATGKLFDLANALGCRQIFRVPDGVGGRFSVLSAVGLLPAALMGLDVVRLLEGAGDMTTHFRESPVGDNRVLDFVGVCHLMEEMRGATIRVLSLWSSALESVGLWYDQLLAESLGKGERGACPLTVVNTRDLHSRAQQHQEGRRDKLVTNVIVEQCRSDPLRIGKSELDQDGLNAIADKTMPQLMAAAIAGTNAAYREDARPTTDIRLPEINEYWLGQLFQMLMLATVVEGRLIGINPYGQPGVEGYKRHMKQNLGP